MKVGSLFIVVHMIRVPFNKTLDAADCRKLKSEFDRYSNEVQKNPNYGKRRAAREKRSREYHYRKKLQELSDSVKGV
jgi:hypothetical protein